MKSSRMTTYILVAMVLGIALGGVVHDQFPAPATQKMLAGYVSIGSMIFLRLINDAATDPGAKPHPTSRALSCVTPRPHRSLAAPDVARSGDDAVPGRGHPRPPT